MSERSDQIIEDAETALRISRGVDRLKQENARLKQHKVLLREALVACFEYVEGIEHLCKGDRQEREMWSNTMMLARDALGLPKE